MPTYVVLVNYTQRAVENVKDLPKGLDAAKEVARSMGVEWKAYYWVMGQYDAVVIAEAPDDDTVAKYVLARGAAGNVRTETLRAFTEDEFRKFVAALP